MLSCLRYRQLRVDTDFARLDAKTRRVGNCLRLAMIERVQGKYMQGTVMKAIFITGATALLLGSVSAYAQTQPPMGDAAISPPAAAPAADTPPSAPPAPEAGLPAPDAAMPSPPPAPAPAPDAAPPTAAVPAIAPEARADYPKCSKTVQDSCVNPSEAGVVKKKTSHRRHH